MSWSSPEIAGAAHGAVAILYVFGSETPFSRHYLEPPFDREFPLLPRKREQYTAVAPSCTLAGRAGSSPGSLSQREAKITPGNYITPLT
jgi:hypothetical protein